MRTKKALSPSVQPVAELMRDDAVVKHELVALMGVRVDRRKKVGKVDQAHVRADVTREAGEFGIGTQMIVHPCDARQIVEARVARTKRGGRKIGQRARVGEPALGAVEHQRLALGGAIPALAVVAELERTAAFASDEVDDTADRRRTVKRAACAAHHLDSVEIVAGHVGHVEATGRTAVDVNAIHEDQRLGRGRATNGDVGLRARRSALLDHDAGHLAQDVACGMDLLLLNLMRLDDAHRGADRIERLLHPRRRHHKDHLWQLAMGLGSSCGFFGFSLRVSF